MLTLQNYAEACQLKFIGPSYQSIQKMGIKDVAKAEMIKANVPVVPGSDGLMKDVSEAKKIAQKIGYPVIISCWRWRKRYPCCS